MEEGKEDLEVVEDCPYQPPDSSALTEDPEIFYLLSSRHCPLCSQCAQR